MLQYNEVFRLSNEHTKGITKVSFSPNGTYLATAGLDARVCIWSVEKGNLLYCFAGTSPVLELIWNPAGEDWIICGLADGYIGCLDLSGDTLDIRGFFAHAQPIECLALDTVSGRLACGAGPELSIWRWNAGTLRYDRVLNGDGPPKNSYNESKEVLVTSIHWISTTRYPSALVVTYLHHGIVILDTATWARAHTFSLNGLILRASVSDDGARIVVSNGVRGFDVYSLASGAPLCTVDHDIRRQVPTPAIWIHGGLAILGASTAGQLTLWDVKDVHATRDDEQPQAVMVRIMYRLPVPKQSEAIAVAAHYDAAKDQFYLAAGIMNVDGHSPCILWKAEEPQQNNTNFIVAPSPARGRARFCFLTCFICFSWLVSVVCVAGFLYIRSSVLHDEL